jgi:glycosyltransferase involved in cell wall biosynthesis
MSIAVTHIIAFDEAPEKDLAGSYGIRIAQLLKGLVSSGTEVEVIALIQSGGMYLENYLADLERHSIVVTRVTIGRVFDDFGLFRHLLSLLRKRRNRVVHTHMQIASTIGRAAAIVARVSGIVNTWYDTRACEGMEYFKQHLLEAFTDYTIAIAPPVAAHLVQNLAFNAEKVLVIRYGIKPPEVLIPRDKAREEMQLPAEGFAIGYVGPLVRTKNIPLAFEAMEGLDGAVFCVIGSGEEEPHLRRRVADLNLASIVFMSERSADYMTAFDLMVLPSRVEETGTMLLEAMIRNVPVAGAANGAIPDILDNGQRGFLFNTAKDLRYIIEQMMRNPNWADHRVTAANQDIVTDFTLHATIDRTRRIYQSLSYRA